QLAQLLSTIAEVEQGSHAALEALTGRQSLASRGEIAGLDQVAAVAEQRLGLGRLCARGRRHGDEASDRRGGETCTFNRCHGAPRAEGVGRAGALPTQPPRSPGMQLREASSPPADLQSRLAAARWWLKRAPRSRRAGKSRWPPVAPRSSVSHPRSRSPGQG